MTSVSRFADGTAEGLALAGHVDFDNAEDVCEQGLALLRQNPKLDAIDLRLLEQGSSAAAAVMLVWAQETRPPTSDALPAQDTAPLNPVRLLNLPDSLRRVLESTGMDDLFVTQ